ncbi:hypothetical protein ACN9M0_27355 [Streptomyces sp. R-07]|uniref:hypothetical protein n=1 Tax=Streptomyces sp. R-07 TaxID=3404052 RepID=UPI003CFB9BDB
MSRTRRGPLRTPFRGLPLAAAVLMAAAAIAAAPALAPAANADEGNPTVLSRGAGRTGRLGNGTTVSGSSR